MYRGKFRYFPTALSDFCFQTMQSYLAAEDSSPLIMGHYEYQNLL